MKGWITWILGGGGEEGSQQNQYTEELPKKVDLGILQIEGWKGVGKKERGGVFDEGLIP